MSVPLETSPNDSAGTLPDVSLGSLDSAEFHSPPRPEQRPSLMALASLSTVPSSATLSTPSPSQPTLVPFPRRMAEEGTPKPFRLASYPGDDLDGDDATEARHEPQTPVTQRSKHGTGTAKAGVNLTLREQEKVIDSFKKENFSLKLKVHFLEERLSLLAPEHVEAAFKQNINLKIEVQSRGVELKKYKKLLLELEKELQNAQKGVGGSKARERELEDALAEREREMRELRRRRAVGPGDGALREAEARNAELEDRHAMLEEQLENMKAVMEENVDEIDRLKDELVHKGNESMTSEGSESRRARLERKLAEVEDENEDLRARHEDDIRMIEQRDEEREALEDELERMRLGIEDLERRREAETLERSESRAQVFEEREEREAMEDKLNAVRDQLAATTIELQQREDELELKCREIDDMLADHKHQIDAVDDGWRGEVEEARGHVEELRDLIADRDAESRELRSQLEELEDTNRTAHAKFEAALEHQEQQLELKDDEIEAGNVEIERLGQRVWELEDEGERLKDDNERVREEAAVDREALESVTTALREKLASAKAQLQEMTSLYEQVRQEVLAHRERQEQLARHAEDLAAEVQAERDAREQLDNELDTLERHREDDARRHQRAIDEKEAEVRSALDTVSRQKAIVSERDADLTALQTALKNLEAETRRAGESHTNDKFSLELELDRLKRDLARLEDDLSRARAELADREARSRDRDDQLDRLHVINRDLTAELATQTQARLNATEKLDITQASLKAAETELATIRVRVNELEQRSSKDQRSLLSNENQFRDQLTERNTLLLTIYQYMDKILGVDKSPRKAGSETKPFTNFSVFHDSLISKLKSLSQIQLDFDKRAKEAETRFSDKLSVVKKQLDNYSKQIDGFEKAVRGALENKHSWRRKYVAKEGELEALKASNTELNSQLSMIKTAPTTKDSEIRALTARWTNAERRLVNSQNQLATAEEKNAHYLDKQLAADQKWEARVKEYEVRVKAADERVKRERQGAKERLSELENHIKTLQKQIDHAKRHGAALSDLVENNKAATAGR